MTNTQTKLVSLITAFAYEHNISISKLSRESGLSRTTVRNNLIKLKDLKTNEK